MPLKGALTIISKGPIEKAAVESEQEGGKFE